MEKKKLLNIDEVAEYLNVSKPTIYRIVDSRQISFYKIRGSLRFSQEDIDKYLEQNKIDSIK